MQDGATRFGWSRRNAKHSAVKEGNLWVGMGMAAATRGNLLQPSKCAVKFDDQGVLTVRMAMTDIGTGSYTIFTQVAAEMMGVPTSLPTRESDSRVDARRSSSHRSSLAAATNRSSTPTDRR